LVLDERLQVLAWTWFISHPDRQISTPSCAGSQQTSGAAVLPTVDWNEVRRREKVPPGMSGGAQPPWRQPIIDMRLLNVDGRLFCTYICMSCKFSLSKLHLTRTLTADGGISELRAWSGWRSSLISPWLQGRNQALFVRPSRVEAGSDILISPWIGVAGFIGKPIFVNRSVGCYGGRFCQPQMRNRRYSMQYDCGPSPLNSTIDLEEVAHYLHVDKDGRRFRSLNSFSHVLPLGNALPGNLSAADFGGAMRRGELEHAGELSELFAGGMRLSSTANLVRIPRATHRMGADGSEATCAVYLGVGHLHRGAGKMCNGRADCKQRKRPREPTNGRGRRLLTRPPLAGPSGQPGAGKRPREPTSRGRRLRHVDLGRPVNLTRPVNRLRAVRAVREGKRLGSGSEHEKTNFQFGYQYTHFFYAVSAAAPHRLLAASSEFCVPSVQDPEECESVQFITGLQLVTAGRHSSGLRPLQSDTVEMRQPRRECAITEGRSQAWLRRYRCGGNSTFGARHEQLLLTFGVNDCEAKTATMPLERVWSMLQPLQRVEEMRKAQPVRWRRQGGSCFV